MIVLLAVIVPQLAKGSQPLKYRLTTSCIETSTIVSAADGVSWQIALVLKDEAANRLAAYSNRHIGERLQFVSSTGEQLSPVSTIQTVLPARFKIAGFLNRKDAKLAYDRMEESGECGEST